mmetsp:Transcript_21325/g.59229  ORF Transcript_21325/g.59229 Transcript_21325/m.59229 type:complete len:421 (+) Transcript_21325:223-1485(+)|eukprot:CAMPEP_0117681154 /NCGR_PEP_ID=MMETSP0804-20121206/18802_1 /TAXON_ID=1074897 /ORGANISM="Tetraselmis astigmatica, Strain CCMP880" /LENGTH=420 /DNA_ID=CAMNT_0005490835 /DNA_START=149 /DNA_END=1411 /DNA_ORIENTATION=-
MALQSGTAKGQHAALCVLLLIGYLAAAPAVATALIRRQQDLSAPRIRGGSRHQRRASGLGLPGAQPRRLLPQPNVQDLRIPQSHPINLQSSLQQVDERFEAIGTQLPQGHRCLKDMEGGMPRHKITRAVVDCGDGRPKMDMAMALYAKNDIVSSQIAQQRGWEIHATAKMTKALRDGAAQRGTSNGTLIDIGANVGWYTMHMAMCGHDIIAVEPFRENANLLQASVCLNGLESKVKLLRYALGTENIECAMISGGTNHGDGISICHMQTLLQWAKSPVEKYTLIGTMQVRTLDSLLEDTNLTGGAVIDVLKIDIEGHELHALRGAQGLLGDDRRAPPVLFSEFAPHMMKASQADPQEYLSLLRGLGYNLCKLRDNQAPWQMPPPGPSLEHLLATDIGIWDLLGTRQAGPRGPNFQACSET